MVLTPVAGVRKPAAPTGQPQGRRRQPCERGFRVSEARTCVLALPWVRSARCQTFFAALASVHPRPPAALGSRAAESRRSAPLRVSPAAGGFLLAE